MNNFEFFEHTADIGLRIYGKNIDELFINSANALINLLVDYKPQIETKRDIFLSADTFENLLIYWLNEIISLFYTYGFIPLRYNLIIIDSSLKEIKGSMDGGILLSQKTLKTEIKAATYHNVNIEKYQEGLKVEIVFDA